MAEPTSSAFIKSKVKQALDKVAEATDPSKSLSREEFVVAICTLLHTATTDPINERFEAYCKEQGLEEDAADAKDEADAEEDEEWHVSAMPNSL